MIPNGLLLFQHANGENAWVGLDGRSGDIVDMKERKVHMSIIHIHANFALMLVCMSKHDLSIL
jgi:hypothetical protein